MLHTNVLSFKSSILAFKANGIHTWMLLFDISWDHDKKKKKE